MLGNRRPQEYGCLGAASSSFGMIPCCSPCDHLVSFRGQEVKFMLFWVALSKVTEVSAVATSLARGRQQPTRKD